MLDINLLTEITQLRLEYNDLSNTIPESICELELNNADYLEFDLTGNMLCPPYPECIEGSVGYQNITDCFDLGDVLLPKFLNRL